MVDFQLQHARHWEIVMSSPSSPLSPPTSPLGIPERSETASPASSAPSSAPSSASVLSGASVPTLPSPPPPPAMLSHASGYLPRPYAAYLPPSAPYPTAATPYPAWGAEGSMMLARDPTRFKRAAPAHRLQCKAPGCTQTFSHRSSRSRHHKRFHSKKAVR